MNQSQYLRFGCVVVVCFRLYLLGGVQSPRSTALANALPVFSLDVVGIVAQYLVCRTALPKSTAVEILRFGSAGERQFRSRAQLIACNPDDGNIWVGEPDRCLIYDGHGRFLRQACLPPPPRSGQKQSS